MNLGVMSPFFMNLVNISSDFLVEHIHLLPEYIQLQNFLTTPTLTHKTAKKCSYPSVSTTISLRIPAFPSFLDWLYYFPGALSTFLSTERQI